MSVNVALIVAAGRGKRFGGARPKQFQPLLDRPVLTYSTRVFDRCEHVEAYGLMVPPGFVDTARELLGDRAREKCRFVRPGGKTRRLSVRKGLREFAEWDPRNVLVHDGVRPGLTRSLVDRLIEPLEEDEDLDGVIPVLPLRDTVKKMENHGSDAVERTLDRDLLRRVQTPQAFRFEFLKDVHEDWDPEEGVTDDAMMVEDYGGRIKTVKGLEQNRKITYPADLRILELYLDGEFQLDG